MDFNHEIQSAELTDSGKSPTRYSTFTWTRYHKIFDISHLLTQFLSYSTTLTRLDSITGLHQS